MTFWEAFGKQISMSLYVRCDICKTAIFDGPPHWQRGIDGPSAHYFLREEARKIGWISQDENDEDICPICAEHSHN